MFAIKTGVSLTTAPETHYHFTSNRHLSASRPSLSVSLPAGLGLNCDFAWEVLQKSQDGDAKFIRNGDFAWDVLPKWQDDDVKRTCLARYLLIKVCKNLRKMKVFAMLRHLACILVSSSILEPSWGHLGALLGPSWAHLGAILGPCWAILDHSWAHLGPILGHLHFLSRAQKTHVPP